MAAMRRDQTWVVASGGGARGRCEPPQIQGAIDETLAATGLFPAGFVGNSIGATTARFAAANAMEELDQFSRETIRERDVQRVNDPNPLDGWKSLNIFMRRLRPYLEAHPCTAQCWVLVTDRNLWAPGSGEPEDLPGAKLVRIDRLSVAAQLKWIGRSSAILPFHEPVEGWRYMDGGAVAVYPPLPRLARKACARLYAVGASPYKLADRAFGRWERGSVGVLNQLSEVHVGNILRRDVARLTRYAEAMDVWISAPDNLADVGDTFEFGAEIDSKRIAAGHRAWANRVKL
jgi:hypothetical protein